MPVALGRGTRIVQALLGAGKDLKDATSVRVGRTKERSGNPNTDKALKDEPEDIHLALNEVKSASAILLTGGTGLTNRDITWAVVEQYCDEPLPAFAVLFTQLSYAQVGSAAVLSRATAGIRRNRNQLIVALPGSSKACTLAMDEILIPELSHIVGHLNK